MAVASLDAPVITEAQRPYRPYGRAEDVLYGQVPEILMAGPAGTGKSRACLEKLHLCAEKYPGMRGLIVRKTRESLTHAAIVTFEQKVLPEGTAVRFHHESQTYRYPNGSRIVVGGLDKASKVMSTEYDIIYVQEATELTEDDWESLTTRLRAGTVPYQQLIADCNPDAPTHWLKQRCDRGQTVMLESRHEDNPTVTEAYLAKLDALTGVRYQRLRLGRWAAAEGMVYDGWDRAKHLIDAFPIPPDWPRYWVLDFGFTNPFVCQWWATDPDGRAYRYRELYQTHLLVEDAAAAIVRASGGEYRREGEQIIVTWPATAEPRPRAVICDHDAEGRATFERHAKVQTVAAYKAVQDGIQAVQSRLKDAGDGRPRLFFLRNALIERDPARVDAKRPTCAEDEIDGYVWDTRNNRKRGEEPLKDDDHGMDNTRYMVAYLDVKKRASAVSPGGASQASRWR